MPSSTSSSSSEDEDLSQFASCAVSADQLQQHASAAARKRAQQRQAGAAAAVGRPSPASQQTPGQDERGGSGGSGSLHTDVQPAAELDLVSAKIAAALDAILARQLDHQPDQHTAAAAAAAAATPQAGPPPPPAADDNDDASGVQLFRSVPKGTPCVLQQHDHGSCGGAWEQQEGPGPQQHRQQRLRDLIPRLSLAERSRQAGKRKHQRVLAELAVEGQALLAAAAAAGYSGGQRCSPAAGSSSKKPGKAAGTTASWVKAWRRLKGGQKAQGVVLDAKPWISYDVRTAKLLGSSPPVK